MRDLASLIAHAELPMLGPLETSQIEWSLDALPPVSRAVDLGAGRADVALRVHERFGATVIAIERSDVLAAEARRRVAGRVTVIEGDAREELAKLRSLTSRSCSEARERSRGGGRRSTRSRTCRRGSWATS
ncbi:MAG: class I SAM-dependent methyltransferase [Sandaracinus sp.]|nr:class I SAM-dependent methyltransferase [Sandaracinus sp.]